MRVRTEGQDAVVRTAGDRDRRSRGRRRHSRGDGAVGREQLPVFDLFERARVDVDEVRAVPLRQLRGEGSVGEAGSSFVLPGLASQPPFVWMPMVVRERR